MNGVWDGLEVWMCCAGLLRWRELYGLGKSSIARAETAASNMHTCAGGTSCFTSCFLLDCAAC